MFGRKKTDVLIVGAGPVGMITALALAQKGVATMIVDKADRSCSRSNALAIHPEAMVALERLGLKNRIMEESYPIDRISIFDQNQARETIHYDELPSNCSKLLSVPQNVLESIIEDELAHLGVPVLWNHRVIDLEQRTSHIEAKVDRLSERLVGYAVARSEFLVDKTLTISAKLLIGADGYNSTIRRLLRIETEEMATPQYHAMFEFETDIDPHHAIRISFDNKLIAAQYPMPSGIGRLCFQFDGLTLPSEYRNKERDPVQDVYANPELLDDRHLQELIKQRVPWNTGYINRMIWRAVAPFEQRTAKSIRDGRAFLLGDAARTFGPLGFASMNLGILEAEYVGTTIIRSLGDRRLLTAIDELVHDFRNDWRVRYHLEEQSIPIDMADPWVAMNRGRLLSSLPASSEQLERLASQLFIHLTMPHMVDA